MWFRQDLLKSIWHAFTSLDVDRRGKVSKSQLKVLSYNLCTVMKIPHDPVAFEEHFKDDNEGPLSNEGYMPYLNRYILDKVQEDFNVAEFHRMCWTLCYKKKMFSKCLHIPENDAFKIWCIFNFLSEEKYPLVIVIEEVEYFLRKLTDAVGLGWSEEKFNDYKRRLSTKNFLTAWETVELVGMSYFCRAVDSQTLSMGINEVYTELIMDVLKQGYMMKKGHKRKNWTERWFVLRPTLISYYTSEDLIEKKGDILLDQSCCVESLLDRDGKKCLFIIKCTEKSFEISAPDKKKKQEWIQAVQTCIQQRRLGLLSPHNEARLRRRELRQKKQVEGEDLAEKLMKLQVANESKERQLEDMRMKMEEAAAKATLEELKRKKTEEDLQDRHRLNLEKEKMERLQMEEQMTQKSRELQQYLQRLRELEDMYHQLEEALEDEKQAKQDEEDMGKLQARLLEEEGLRRRELELLHLEQQRELVQSETQKQELLADQQAKEKQLQAATQELHRLEREREGALQQYQEVSKKLERATNKTKKWKDRVAQHEGLVRLIQPGHKEPQKITNWGPASFTDSELELKMKLWRERKMQGAPTQ